MAIFHFHDYGRRVALNVFSVKKPVIKQGVQDTG